MAWRDEFLRWFGPGMLGGITFGDWIRLLRDNRFDVPPRRLLRAMAITAQSAQNSVMKRIEDLRYGAAVCDVEVQPPLFVLGHWRSGTTHLHNLLAVDERFAFPNNYQALFPHAMLSMERMQAPFIQWFLSPRRPMDNIEWTMRSPQEDEFALCVMTFMSPCMGWFFPKRREHYDRYLTFRGVDEREVKRWQAALVAYLKRLSWKYQRPLVLKSPPHTGRIRRLLELFPRAKFVHVHRDPYEVFSSTRKMLTVNFSMHCLEHVPTPQDLDAWIIRQYRAMHDAFFEERDLIPPGHFHELRFDELEADPIGQMERVYDSLGLGEFSQVRPALRRYVDGLRGYQKNEFPELPVALRFRIADAWRPCFQQWGYAQRDDHERVVVEQFTRQADGFREFAEMPGQPRDMVLAATPVDARDSVLDVACGPGVTTCDLAEVAGRAIGIDVTPAMIEQAKELQRRRKLTNVTWHVGSVPPLPFDDGAFSLVFTRYSFHHFPDPFAVLKEMVRVCSATGTIVVVDVFMTTTEQADAYNHLEKLRDPSHVRALQLAEFEALFLEAGLEAPRKFFYKQPMSLELLLRGSFPNPGDAKRVRQIIVDDERKDELGLGVHRSDGDFHFAYPIAVFVGRKINSK